MIHFLQAQATIRANRSMARHGCKEFIPLLRQALGLTMLNKICEDVADELLCMLALKDFSYLCKGLINLISHL